MSPGNSDVSSTLIMVAAIGTQLGILPIHAGSGGSFGPTHGAPSRSRASDDSAPAFRVLLVDDDRGTLDTFSRFFRLAGFEVTVAASGETGRAASHRREFDAILLDLYLPDMSGIALLAELRASGNRAPVVMMSGFGTVEEAAAATRLGASDFLSKPLDADRLVSLVQSLIGSRTRIDPAAGAAPVAPAAAGPRRDTVSEIRASLAALAAGEDASGASGGAAARETIASLARAIAHEDLSVHRLLACGRALGRLAAAPGEDDPPAGSARGALEALGQDGEPAPRLRHAKVAEALSILAADDGSGLRVRQRELARRLGIGASHLGRLLRTQTRWSFGEWRRAFRLRHGVRHLARTDEQVRQIAYKLGYRDAGHFNHDFKDAFGISPRTFRQLLVVSRTVPVSVSRRS